MSMPRQGLEMNYVVPQCSKLLSQVSPQFFIFICSKATQTLHSCHDFLYSFAYFNLTPSLSFLLGLTGRSNVAVHYKLAKKSDKKMMFILDQDMACQRRIKGGILQACRKMKMKVGVKIPSQKDRDKEISEDVASTAALLCRARARNWGKLVMSWFGRFICCTLILLK